MKKFFLDHFYIRSVVADQYGNIRLKCFAVEEQSEAVFSFDFSMRVNDFKSFIKRTKKLSKKISGLISGAFTSLNFSKSLDIDFCWLKISYESLPLSEEFDEESIYMVEDFGLIPE